MSRRTGTGTTGEQILARLDAHHRLAVLHGDEPAPVSPDG